MSYGEITLAHVQAVIPIWEEQGCSKPGCAYPDGRPCIGCGLVVSVGEDGAPFVVKPSKNRKSFVEEKGQP